MPSASRPRASRGQHSQLTLKPGPPCPRLTVRSTFARIGLAENSETKHFRWVPRNPVGGGNAVGKVQASFPYECASTECIKLGGKALEIVPDHMPENVEVSEPSPGVFRQKTGNKANMVEPGSVE